MYIHLCPITFYRLQLGQMEVLELTKFHISAGVLSKISLNFIYVKEAAF